MPGLLTGTPTSTLSPGPITNAVFAARYKVCHLSARTQYGTSKESVRIGARINEGEGNVEHRFAAKGVAGSRVLSFVGTAASPGKSRHRGA
jgi:hypothetical protein